MSSGSRADRGRATELLAAKYYKERLWPQCRANQPSTPGKDLLETPGAAMEIKARTGFNPNNWMKQAIKNTGEGEVSLVLMRPNGVGPENIDYWPVFMLNRDFVDLWRKANGNRTVGQSPFNGSGQEDQESPSHRYRVRLESESHYLGGPLLQGILSLFLYEMGIEFGDYEVSFQRSKSS